MRLLALLEDLNHPDRRDVRWAVGKHADKAKPSTQRDFHDPEYVLVWANIKDIFDHAVPNMALDVEDPMGGKNRIGQRVPNAKMFWAGGGHMDPSLIYMRGSKVDFVDGRHRLVAAYQLGHRFAPVLVPKEVLPAFQSVVRVKQDEAVKNPRSEFEPPFKQRLGPKGKPKMRPDKADLVWIRKMREKVRAEEGGGGYCHVMSEIIMDVFGWKWFSGTYTDPKDDPICPAHVWNILPDGALLDSTADQFGEGHDIRIIEKNDPDHPRYRYEWMQDYHPDHPDADDDVRGKKWSKQYDFERAIRLDKQRGRYWWLKNKALIKAYEKKQREYEKARDKAEDKDWFKMDEAIKKGEYGNNHWTDHIFAHNPSKQELGVFFRDHGGAAGVIDPRGNFGIGAGSMLDHMTVKDQTGIADSSLPHLQVMPQGVIVELWLKDQTYDRLPLKVQEKSKWGPKDMELTPFNEKMRLEMAAKIKNNKNITRAYGGAPKVIIEVRFDGDVLFRQSY